MVDFVYNLCVYDDNGKIGSSFSYFPRWTLMAEGIPQTRHLPSPACDAIATRSASHRSFGRLRACTHLAGLGRFLWFAVDAFRLCESVRAHIIIIIVMYCYMKGPITLIYGLTSLEVGLLALPFYGGRHPQNTSPRVRQVAPAWD